jgi:hypothetical protein
MKCGVGKRDGGVVDSMKRGHKCSQKRLEKLDEYGLQCSQEFVNVCKLKDALVCDLGSGK